ncbi:MAG: YebC/PmpR family DNA-binding transcriptional regulator [Armatimonadota bacterium]
MSGHSKWHNIREKKGKMDAKRGKMFTKIAKEIFMAVKEGGADPEVNYRLKIAIGKAKEVNMPADNIKRTIDKATGAGGAENYETIVYEGYGPNGVAIIIEVATDNRNRTAGEVRSLFSKYGGNLGETGCVGWMFAQKGLITVDKTASEEEKLMEVAINAGASDFKTLESSYEIETEISDFHKVKTALEDNKIKLESANIIMIPQNTVELNKDQASSILKLMEAIEEHDDVQQVHANFDIPEEILQELA